MNIQRITLFVLLFSLLVVGSIISCNDGDDDDDDNDDEGDCSGEPDHVPGEPYPHGDAWQPPPGTSWQWQLIDAIDTSFEVDMYDIDLFDNSADLIQELQDDGRIVICYFSAGSYEDWRDDAGDFPEEALGNTLEGWEDERWLDITNQEVRQIMMDRMDVAEEKGCDGVEPDNMDGYTNNNGLGLTAEDQIDFNRFIADEAHKRGLSVGLKNDTCQLENLVDWYNWALNEECFTYGECDLYDAFLDEGKAVFNTEYVDDWGDALDLADEICDIKPELDTIIKEWDLTANRLSCDEI